MKKRGLLLSLVVFSTVVSVGAAVWFNLGFRQGADVVATAHVIVYQNEGLTDILQPGEMIDWGQITSGANTKSLWIHNDGQVDAILQFNYDGQQMPGDWTETWDYDNSPLAVDATLMVNMTLTLPENIGAGHYEWNSGISATEAPP